LSNIIKNMTVDLGKSKEIYLHFPLQTIREGFIFVKNIQNALKTKKIPQKDIIQTIMKNHTSEQLINITNFIHKLEFQADIQNVCMATIRTLIDRNSERVVHNKT